MNLDDGGRRATALSQPSMSVKIANKPAVIDRRYRETKNRDEFPRRGFAKSKSLSIIDYLFRCLALAFAEVVLP